MVANGRHPAETAAGAIYLAGQLTGEQLTQQAVATEAGVAPVTIRKRYRDSSGRRAERGLV